MPRIASPIIVGSIIGPNLKLEGVLVANGKYADELKGNPMLELSPVLSEVPISSIPQVGVVYRTITVLPNGTLRGDRVKRHEIPVYTRSSASAGNYVLLKDAHIEISRKIQRHGETIGFEIFFKTAEENVKYKLTEIGLYVISTYIPCHEYSITRNGTSVVLRGMVDGVSPYDIPAYEDTGSISKRSKSTSKKQATEDRVWDENNYYNVKNGVVTIWGKPGGNGKLGPYKGKSPVSTGANEILTKAKGLVIGQGVTEILDLALKNNRSDIEYITISSGVKKIGARAFEDTHGAKMIMLPDTLEVIGESAFADCLGVEGIVIPPKVKEIPSCAFSSCLNLKEVILGSGCTKICDRAFDDCMKLEKIGKLKIESCKCKVTEIEAMAFRNCAKLRITNLLEFVEVIKDEAFKNCKSLEEINLNHIKNISISAFQGCDGLHHVFLGRNIEKLGAYSFYKCNKIDDLCVDGQGTFEFETVPNEFMKLPRGANYDVKTQGNNLYLYLRQ